jgi:uncharacterized membrane protein YvlD (DUF360 family)
MRRRCMVDDLMPFLLHWGLTALSLWIASHVFSGIKFADTSSSIVSALLLCLANATVKALLIALALLLTLLTFGIFRLRDARTRVALARNSAHKATLRLLSAARGTRRRVARGGGRPKTGMKVSREGGGRKSRLIRTQSRSHLMSSGAIESSASGHSEGLP